MFIPNNTKINNTAILKITGIGVYLGVHRFNNPPNKYVAVMKT